MPIYQYRCVASRREGCTEVKEIWWPTIPDKVPPTIEDACPACNDDMRLVIGQGVIHRFGGDYLTKKMLETGMIKDPKGRGVDLGYYGN